MKKLLFPFLPLMLMLLYACRREASLQTVVEQCDGKVAEYVEKFNVADNELYQQLFPNNVAGQFMHENIPLFECPDKDLEKTWYFRWWTFRKHIKNTPEGYVITEFLPNVYWAGKYNAINCPAMHHFAEGRWLKNPLYLADYARHWCREKDDATKYSFPMAHSLLEYHEVHPDTALLAELYDDLTAIYAMWRSKCWDEEAGMYWQVDNLDGMEFSISGSYSPDATGYRTTINSYMYADASALAVIAGILGREDDARYYQAEASVLKQIVNERLWDEEARFYKVIPRHRDMSFSPVRELHGYVPWMFDIPARDRSDAWSQLADTLGFKAPYGPTTAEQRSAAFAVSYQGHECQWNGPSWPFATAQTLTALANALHRFGEDGAMTKTLYLETLRTYAHSHRRTTEDGREVCWIDENINPYTGEWIARRRLIDAGALPRERGKDYNHSTFCDLIISGLIGIQPQIDGSLVIHPLIPEGEWKWFSLTRIPWAGKELSIVYDKTGKHYGTKAGLNVYVDGKRVAHSRTYATRPIHIKQ